MPPLSLMRWMMGTPITQSIHAAAKLGIADRLKDGPRSIEQLAESTGTNPDALYRLVRMCTSIGLFTEQAGHRFALTPTGQHLREDHVDSVRSLAIMSGESWHVGPWIDLLGTIRTGEPAFDRLYGMGFFQHLSENPESASIFDRATGATGGGYASAVAAACDLEGVRTVVDVGGGRGTLLASLIERHPSVQGVLFDLPAMTGSAEENLRALGLSGRCRIVSGDFFESVPEGGDVYLLGQVLHNWDDDRAVEILSNCRRAMPRSGRVLAAEIVLTSPPDLYSSALDLEMLVNFGGRERTGEEYGRLFERAGLRPTGVVATASRVSVIAGVAA